MAGVAGVGLRVESPGFPLMALEILWQPGSSSCPIRSGRPIARTLLQIM